jgi:hypothetical protein
MAQHVAAPRHRRTALIVVALLLVALGVGAVTAVNLFPAKASGQVADESTRMNEFRAGERASLTQVADESTRMNEFRAGERASLTQVADESTRMNEFRAGERASLTQVAGPPGR